MISVVLATFNEEKNIEQCLLSVKDFAGEIIVVDGNSKDKTCEIAKRLGAKIIKTTNKKNFHINKQMAMDAAKGNLVLQLDADEAVDDRLIRFIKTISKKIKSKNPPNEVAWWIKRKNLFLGRWLKKGGQYPDPVIRLYINGKAHLPQKDIHEQMEVDGKIGNAEGHLWHYSYPKFSDYLHKFNKYTSFKAKQLLDSKLKINPWTILKFCILKPSYTFLMIYFRHKGFVDGWQGFIFAVFSGLHHLVSYMKFWELKVSF